MLVIGNPFEGLMRIALVKLIYGDFVEVCWLLILLCLWFIFGDFVSIGLRVGVIQYCVFVLYLVGLGFAGTCGFV